MSSAKYRSVNIDESDRHGRRNIESFELEDDEYHIVRVRADRSVRQKICTIVSLLVLLVVVIGYGVREKDVDEETTNRPHDHVTEQEKSMTVATTASNNNTKKMNNNNTSDIYYAKSNSTHVEKKEGDVTTTKLVYCYGDSLTYGMVPQHGSPEAHPYDQSLQQEINTLYANSQSSIIQVKHFGYPGWTSNQMIQHINDGLPNLGVCNIIQHNPTISLIIILVGTNDIGIMANSGTDKNVGSTIADSIIELHKRVFECAVKENKNSNLHTMALGIPGSSYQDRSSIAAELATYINKALKDFASSTSLSISYVDFPFLYQQNDTRWGSDGLHLSANGYDVLGKELAPYVKTIVG